MHPLQAHVLKQLTLISTGRYRDLKPAGIESNKFIYHLRKLVDQGWLTKKGVQYHLTAAGKRYVDKLSLQNFQTRMQPKIVTVIVCRNPEGKYLCIRRHREPFFEKIGFPYGKIHFGESIQQAATRELLEKTGLTADLRHRGQVYLIIKEHGEVVSHMLAHVFVGTHPRGTIKSAVATHSVNWEDLTKLSVQDFIPGFLELQRLSEQTKNLFFKEIITS